jgi:hypothetical protein
MDTQPDTTASSFVYNRIPTKVSRKDFNRYIEPHLHLAQSVVKRGSSQRACFLRNWG